MRFSPIFNDLRPKMDALGNPERIAIARPRVARNELPWGKRAKRLSTLKGLNRRAGARTITPWHNHWPGYWFMPFFQQRTVVHFCATLPCAKNSTGTSAGYWPISNASRLLLAVSKTMFISCAPCRAPARRQRWSRRSNADPRCGSRPEALALATLPGRMVTGFSPLDSRKSNRCGDMSPDKRSTIARYHFKMSIVNFCGGMNWNLTNDICGNDSTLSGL